MAMMSKMVRYDRVRHPSVVPNYGVFATYRARANKKISGTTSTTLFSFSFLFSKKKYVVLPIVSYPSPKIGVFLYSE